jgi:microcin C transport system substrate-binding protein
MTRHPAFLALAAATLSILTACGPARTPSAPVVTDVPVEVETTGESDPIAVPTAQRGGTFATWGGPYPKSLNSWLDYNSFSANVCGLMFESLVALHSTKDEPVGVLAESWETSAGGTTFTFRLDPRAKWSDGRSVTAEDVQFYYDVIMNEKNLTSVFRVGLSRFSRPEVVDPHTLRITATEPHWANFWTAAGLVAFPKHVWKDVDFNKQNFEFPVVSGPYALEEVKTNRSISLQRRGDWWGRSKQYNVGKFNFDHLLFISMEDRNKMLEVFKKGEIDAYPIYTAQIWAEKTNFPQIQKNWIVRQEVDNREPKGVQGLVVNLRREKFQDPRVRQALALVFNRQLMNEKLMFNQYFLLNSYYPDLYPDNTNPDLPATPYDPSAARALLKEAGWEVGSNGVLAKDGQPFDLSILFHGEDLRHMNIYIEDLKAIGIRPKIDLVSRASFTKRTDTQDFDVFWLATGAGRLRDPEGAWSSKQANEIATNNYSGVADAKIDELIERQKTEPDLAVRNDILRQIDARLMEISPYVLMWQSRGSRLLYWNKFGTPKYVLDKFNREDSALTYWWLDQEKEAALNEAMRTNTALPPEPAEVIYAD